MTETLEHHIGGRRVAGESSRVGQVFNPSTGEVARRVRLGGAGDVDAAVHAAQAALPAWQATPPAARARIMFRYRALLEAHADEIADLISREHGKTLDDARGSLIRGWEVVEFACGIPHLLKGEHSRDVGTGIDTWSLLQPLGVCAGITPFNFPAMIPLWMFPLAIDLRQYLHPEAVRARPVGAPCGWWSCSRKPAACRRGSSTSSTATRSPCTRCSRIPTSRP